MSREIFFVFLVPLYAGPLIWLGGQWLARQKLTVRGDGEREAWARLWAPLWLPGLLTAALVGFGLEELVDGWLHEPEGEVAVLRPLALVLSLPCLVVALRAGWRLLAALSGESRPPIAAVTVGLWRPRIAIDPEFAAQLSAGEREAVLAHELAHLRHRDPLRILAARCAADLQWPFAAAPRTLAAWLERLELARDDEARRQGIDGPALASAIVAAARFSGEASAAMAGLGGQGGALRHRIERLLGPPVSMPQAPRARRWVRRWAFGGSLALALVVGFAEGEALLRVLPGVRS